MSDLTLLEVAQAVARDVGLAQPTAVVGATDDTDRGMVEMKQHLDFVGEELARRVDWSALRSEVTLTGNGSALEHPLPASYLRMMAGNAVKLAVSFAIVRGGLSAEEFKSLPPVVGTPRFYFIGGPRGAKTISFWPFLANTFEATALVQSENWVASATSYQADGNIALVPSPLMVKGGIARWRRQKGMDYADYVAEYEAALANYAEFDDGARSP
ncbi:MAG: hypothetical protein ABL936_00445 [Aestuariivirga sp.]